MFCCVSSRAGADRGPPYQDYSKKNAPFPLNNKKLEQHIDSQDVPALLLPCAICTRTFLPQSLEKHRRICERSTTKKRKPFDSAKQRIQGTELAQFQPPPTEQKRRAPNEDRSSASTRPTWKETHDDLLQAIRAAREDSVEESKPAASTSTQGTGPPMRANEKGTCPTCNRQFGVKAYERHVAWCKEKATRLPSSPATNQAKERLEARMRYRAPALKNRRALVREKYSPSSAMNLNAASRAASSSAGSRPKESLSAPNFNKQNVSKRTGSTKESLATNGPMKSRIEDRLNRPIGDNPPREVTSISRSADITYPTWSPSSSSVPPFDATKLNDTSFCEANLKKKTKNKRNQKKNITYENVDDISIASVKNEAFSNEDKINSAKSTPLLNDISVNNNSFGVTVQQCTVSEIENSKVWKRVDNAKNKEPNVKLKSGNMNDEQGDKIPLTFLTLNRTYSITESLPNAMSSSVEQNKKNLKIKDQSICLEKYEKEKNSDNGDSDIDVKNCSSFDADITVTSTPVLSKGDDDKEKSQEIGSVKNKSIFIKSCNDYKNDLSNVCKFTEILELPDEENLIYCRSSASLIIEDKKVNNCSCIQKTSRSDTCIQSKKDIENKLLCERPISFIDINKIRSRKNLFDNHSMCNMKKKSSKKRCKTYTVDKNCYQCEVDKTNKNSQNKSDRLNVFDERKNSRKNFDKTELKSNLGEGDNTYTSKDSFDDIEFGLNNNFHEEYMNRNFESDSEYSFDESYFCELESKILSKKNSSCKRKKKQFSQISNDTMSASETDLKSYMKNKKFTTRKYPFFNFNEKNNNKNQRFKLIPAFLIPMEKKLQMVPKMKRCKLDGIEIETVEKIGDNKSRRGRTKILPNIDNRFAGYSEARIEITDDRDWKSSWKAPSKFASHRNLRLFKHAPKDVILPPVPNPLFPKRGTCKDYDPFLLAEQQMNELLSDTSDQSVTDGSSSTQQTNDSLFPVSPSSAFVKYPYNENLTTLKRTSLIAPPTQFDDLTSDFSSDSTETNSLTKEIFFKDVKNLKEQNNLNELKDKFHIYDDKDHRKTNDRDIRDFDEISKDFEKVYNSLDNRQSGKDSLIVNDKPKSPGRELGRRVIIDKSKALGNEVVEDPKRVVKSTATNIEKARNIVEKVTPKIMKPVVTRSNSIRASSAPKSTPDRKMSNSVGNRLVKKPTNLVNNENQRVSNSSANGKNNNYGSMSGSNVSLSSIVSSELEMKRSNSMFDELMTSFEDENSFYPSLRSYLKSDPLSTSSPFYGSGRKHNGQLSDDELSSPDSFKKQDTHKLSADSAYSSLNRKYLHYGHGTLGDGDLLKEGTLRSKDRRSQESLISNCARNKLSKFCHECGSKFPDTAKFCCECGVKRLAL